MKMHLLLLAIILAIGTIDGKRQCLTNCTVGGYMGVPLIVPDGRCAIGSGDNCQVNVRAMYHDNTYTVTFDTSYVGSYSRFIYILTTNYLSYSATYACSKNNDCALEFARNKVLDLSNRTYNAYTVGSELKPLLEDSAPTGSSLRCYGNDICTGGLCNIDYNTKSNSQRKRGCNWEQYIPVRVSVYDSGSYTSLDVDCNRTECNSLDTVSEVKRILARHNLTDADGRINGSPIAMVSLTLIGGLALLSTFLSQRVL